jgi:hypothetical protein
MACGSTLSGFASADDVAALAEGLGRGEAVGGGVDALVTRPVLRMRRRPEPLVVEEKWRRCGRMVRLVRCGWRCRHRVVVARRLMLAVGWLLLSFVELN